MGSLGMLIVKIHNTDDNEVEGFANYDVEVLITTSPKTLKPIARGRVIGHKRSDGWRKLLRRVANESEDCNA